MAITPVEISNKEFPIRMRGYDRDSVDDFLDKIVQEFEVLIKENANLRDQVEMLTQRLEQYRSLEETINKTLVIAQESAEEIKANAQRKADLVVKQAEAQAERMLEQGAAKSRQIMMDNADLIRVIDTLRNQVRALLKSQLDALDSLPDPHAEVAPGRLLHEPES